jgi:fatty-acyl-CoA synthase
VNIPLVVGDFLDRARSLFGDRIAVVCGEIRFDYRTFAERVDRCAAALHGLGVRKGDVVAYLSFNCHRLLEGYYAVPQIGAILLPINIRLTPRDIEIILRDADATTIVVHRGLAELVAPIIKSLPRLRHIILMGGDPSAPCPLSGEDYEALLAACLPAFPPPQVAEDDVAELFFTSGTTDQPKGVMLTHRNLYLHALFALLHLPMEQNASQLHAIPLCHVNGWGTPHTVTLCGGKHVVLPKFDPAQFLEAIERERVTQVLVVPAVAQAVLAVGAAQAYDLSSLRHLVLGGDVAPPGLVKALDAWLPSCEVTCGYGLTETAPVLTLARIKPGLSVGPEESAMLRSSAGYPIPGVRLEILDDQARTLPHDGASAGEICVRANTVMKGYWKQAELTASTIVADWFHTGDIGTIDERGYLRVVDRKKDLIKTAGENVVSVEIEQIIQEHPAVRECAVIGMPDPLRGEAAAAIIVIKPDHTLGEADIVAHCRRHLAAFKVPRKVIFANSLPKGSTGKTLKRQLRDTYFKSWDYSHPMTT